MSSSATTKALPERFKELSDSLLDIQERVRQSSSSYTTLVAVSKYKPASDILACYECGQRDFGENYVNELEEKAQQVRSVFYRLSGLIVLSSQTISDGTLSAHCSPTRQRHWRVRTTVTFHPAFILGTTWTPVIPNIYAIQTVTSTKAASALNRSLPSERTTPLNIFLQVNTSEEEVKSGLPLLTSVESVPSSELLQLAQHIITNCPMLHLRGLMTIGSLKESLASDERQNEDFETLKRTRVFLEEVLRQDPTLGDKWGLDGKLLLSMGMSSDFEAALRVGSDVVRVGTGIFGARPAKQRNVT